MRRFKWFLIINILTIAFYAGVFQAESSPQEDATIVPVRLRCEYVSEPLGLQLAIPSLSWQFKSELRDQKQTAYQILAANNVETLKSNRGDKWSSGWIESNRSVNISYDGVPLNSREICYWKVRIKDANGKISPWSEPSSFELGLLEESDWQGQWIGMEVSNKKQNNIAPLLRKEFALDKKVSKARIYFSGLGFSELYLNGKKISKNVLSPLFTDYFSEVVYNVYDVTSMLKNGENAVGIWLGNGWFSAGIRDFKNPWADSPRALFQLEIQFEDGSSTIFKSDDSWKATKSPISRNTIDLGEVYDARLEIQGWELTGLNDSDWNNAQILDEPGGKLVSSTLPDMKVMQTVKPVKITNPKEGVWVFHFDKLYSGWARIHTRGKEGQEIQLQYSSRILTDGTIDKRPWPGEEEEDTYIMKGAQDGETYEPKFTFHPLQYVQVTGITEEPDENTMAGCFVYSDIPETTKFECSNNLFNDIHEMVQQTMRVAMKGFLLDCMHREPFGYNEPASVSTALWSRRYMPHFWKKFSHDVFLADGPSGFPSDIVPLFPKLHGTSREPDVSQTTNYPMMIWNVYQQFDDIRIIKEHYPVVKKWLRFIRTMSNEEHVVVKGWLGDHMVPGETPGNELWYSPEVTTQSHIWTSLYFRNVEIAGQMAGVLGKIDEAENYFQLAQEIRKKVNEKWYDAEKRSYDTGSQTANMLPLALGLIPDGEKQAIVESIVTTITEKDNTKLRVGHIGLPSLMETASQNGFGETLYKMVNQTEYPGWGYMLEGGATTVWECWGRDWADLNNSRRRSDCMTMLGGVVRFFYDDIAGIRGPDFMGSRSFETGYKKIIIQPQLLGDLTHASASVETIHGEITSAWKLGNGKFELSIKIPHNTSAEIIIPKSGWNNPTLTEGGIALQPGTINTDVSGVHSIKEDNETITCEVGSGDFTFLLEKQ